jgi:hypothetical protein
MFMNRSSMPSGKRLLGSFRAARNNWQKTVMEQTPQGFLFEIVQVI